MFLWGAATAVMKSYYNSVLEATHSLIHRLRSSTHFVEFLNFQKGERREAETEQARHIDFHKKQSRPVKLVVVDDISQRWKGVYHEGQVPLELHDEKFHNEADVVADVESVPQSQEHQRSKLRNVFIACRSTSRSSSRVTSHEWSFRSDERVISPLSAVMLISNVLSKVFHVVRK